MAAPQLRTMPGKTTERTGDAVLYVRVSTTDQGDRYSPASQTKRLRELAAREGNRVREDWIFVDMHSGKLESRPAFDKMKALVRTGAPAKVYIFDVSRFARKTMDALWLAAELKRHGVALGFYEMPCEDTATGRLQFTQMAAIAEYVGEKILEDSKRGRQQMLEMGRLPHGSACYGYRIDKTTRKLVIDSSMSSVDDLTKRQVVETIFGWRRTGWRTSRIVQELKARNILSAGYIGRGGAPVPPGLWTRQTVIQLLRNRTYMGEHVCSGVIVACEAMISADLFEAVQRVTADAKARTTGRPSKHNYLLTTYLWCGKPDCGYRMKSNPGIKWNGGSYPMMKCGHQDARTRKQICSAPQVLCSKVEPAAWTAVWRMITDPASLLEQCKAFFAGSRKGTSAAAKLEKEAARLKTEIEKTGLMMRKSLMDFDEGERAIVVARQRLREVEGELRDAGVVRELPSVKQAEAAQRRIIDPAKESRLTFDDKRSILEGVQDLRMTYYDGWLTITGAVPMPAEADRIKCNSGQGGGYTCLANIPFKIRERVA